MIIALDYDGTWTAAPRMWRGIIKIMQANGHEVIIATARGEWSDDMATTGLPPMDIIFCGNRLKREVCLEKGYEVDVFIDDNPGTIERCLILQHGEGDDGSL